MKFSKVDIPSIFIFNPTQQQHFIKPKKSILFCVRVQLNN